MKRYHAALFRFFRLKGRNNLMSKDDNIASIEEVERLERKEIEEEDMVYVSGRVAFERE